MSTTGGIGGLLQHFFDFARIKYGNTRHKIKTKQKKQTLQMSNTGGWGSLPISTQEWKFRMTASYKFLNFSQKSSVALLHFAFDAFYKTKPAATEFFSLHFRPSLCQISVESFENWPPFQIPKL